ncbi:MAG: NYN domain-containing protein [Alphaproteobacteria bacterium]|nr:NYN domain-containing protein [Alphaproteobacteria bacterium]
MRVAVYVDGFNLYYRALRKTPYKWLDLHKLSASLIDPTDTIVKIKYFTARVSGRDDPDEPKRQHIYLRALETLPNFEIIYGNFLPKIIKRPLVNPPDPQNRYVQIHTTEEKGSDVNLASHLLHDGWRDFYDIALIMSQDTDFVLPFSFVKNDLKKTIILVWLDGKQATIKLKEVVDHVRHITPNRLAQAQFPMVITDNKGRVLQKPSTWL